MSTDAYRQQDDELDELSASVQRIGGVGLTIHEELTGQVFILPIIIRCKVDILPRAIYFGFSV